MSKMICVSLFLDQHAGKGNKNTTPVASGSFKIPFSAWVVGYVVIADSRRSNNDEEWTIKEIKSADGKMRREDCAVTLVNKAAETREVKGSTLQSGYEFKSTGDVPMPEPEFQMRPDVKPFGVDLEGVREFYPRNGGEGTRLIMHDKTVYIILEDFNFMWEACETAGITVGVYSSYQGKRQKKLAQGAMTGAELNGN